MGAAVLLGINYLFVRMGFHHPHLARVLEGTPTVLVSGGRALDANLRRLDRIEALLSRERSRHD